MNTKEKASEARRVVGRRPEELRLNPYGRQCAARHGMGGAGSKTRARPRGRSSTLAGQSSSRTPAHRWSRSLKSLLMGVLGGQLHVVLLVSEMILDCMSMTTRGGHFVAPPPPLF